MSRRTRMANRAKALANEKKILALTSVVTLVSCFLPWYGINSRVINEWWNAFGSIGSVAGYILTAFSALTLVMVIIPLLKPDTDINNRLPLKETTLLTFMNAQSFFITLVFIPVYRQYALLNASNSGTRFGIYLALGSTLVAAIVALSYQRRVERQGDIQQNFATVPRQQQSINDWERSSQDEEPEEVEEQDSYEQEDMFSNPAEPEEEPVAAGMSYDEPSNSSLQQNDDPNLFDEPRY